MKKRLNDPRWAYVFVNLATLLWASNIALGRALRNDIGPITLTATRFSIAGLLFAFLLLRRQGRQKTGGDTHSSSDLRVGRDWIWLASMGLFGVFGFPTLLYLALQRTTATHVSLINGTAPLLTVFLAAVFIRERVSSKLLIGGMVSLAGVGLVISNGSTELIRSLAFNSGDLIALLNAGIWGLYSVISRIATRSRSSLAATAFSIWFALPLLYPTAAFELQGFSPNLTIPVILAVLYIGIFPSILGFLAWNEGVRRVGPGQAMAFYNMLPVFGVLLAVLFLGESLAWTHFLGGGLVIAGGLIAARGEVKAKIPAEKPLPSHPA
jgi:drug/metabolite transporter (DMT)-like permease